MITGPCLNPFQVYVSNKIKKLHKQAVAGHFPDASHSWISLRLQPLRSSLKSGLGEKNQKKYMLFYSITDKHLQIYFFHGNIFPKGLYIWKINNAFMLLYSTWSFIIVSDRTAGVNSWNEQEHGELKGTRCGSHLGWIFIWIDLQLMCLILKGISYQLLLAP